MKINFICVLNLIAFLDVGGGALICQSWVQFALIRLCPGFAAKKSELVSQEEYSYATAQESSKKMVGMALPPMFVTLFLALLRGTLMLWFLCPALSCLLYVSGVCIRSRVDVYAFIDPNQKIVLFFTRNAEQWESTKGTASA
jgi:hypothetical protein